MIPPKSKNEFQLMLPLSKWNYRCMWKNKWMNEKNAFSYLSEYELPSLIIRLVNTL